MNRVHIPGLPNRIPNIYLQAYLSIFKDQKGDDASLHLFRFHKHIHKLGVELYENYLIKMFMVSLEGKERSWYDGFPTGSLSSFKYFHTIFHEHFERHYPSMLLLQDCCIHDREFIENVKDECGDDQYLDE